MDVHENDSHFGAARVTAQRRSIATVTDSLGGAFTVEDLVAAVQARAPGTGTATVYRAVSAMEHAGSLERVGARDGSALYVRCRADHHHHHLVCTECGSFTATKCPLGAEVTRQAARDGFTVTGHEITLYGLCSRCSEASSEPRDARIPAAEGT